MSASDVSPTSPTPAAGWGTLVASGLVIAVVLGLAASRVPARFRLLGLFPLGLGALTGWLLTQAASRQPASLPSGARLVAGAAALGELVLLLTLSIPPASRASQQAPHPISQAVEAALRDTHPELLPVEPPSNPLRAHLARRLEQTPLGGRPSPVPELIWGLETLAGVLAAALVVPGARRRAAA